MAAPRKKAPAKLVLSRTDDPPAPTTGKRKGKAGKSGRGGEAATDVLRRVYLTALGLVSAVAFLSILVQADGLYGALGLAPVGELLDRAATKLPTWSARLWALPTLAWFLPSGHAAATLAVLGFVASLVVTSGRFVAPALLVAYAAHVSLCNVGGVFLGFQWDGLLAEVLLASVLVAHWGKAPRFAAPVAGWWWLRWILFRLVFFGGLVKLTSGDPTWRDGSALEFHHWTQPLPNGLSLAAAALPWWVHRLSTLLTFLVELVVPFAMFAGRTGRRVVATSVATLMVLLMATGNYGWFQLLTLVLCLTLLDDVDLAALRVRPNVARGAPLPPWGPWVAGALAAVPLLASLVMLPMWYLGREPGRVERAMVDVTSRTHAVNRYGLFARMTTSRPIPVLEARWGDGEWHELTWRWQTSDPLAHPAQVAPHMPRLDWQLWFGGLGGCAPWGQALMVRVLQGSPSVEALIGDLRLTTGAPPDAVRTVVYDYLPADADEHALALQRGGDPVWVRLNRRPWCGELTRAELDAAAAAP